MDDPTPSTFSPTPSSLPRLLRDLADPDLSLTDIADAHNTTLDALSAWMALPEIQSQISDLGSACATRTRLAAVNHLPRAVHTLSIILDTFKSSHAATTTSATTTHTDTTPHARELHRRHAETARRAATLLYHLARFQFAPSSPPPQGGAGVPPAPSAASIPPPRPPSPQSPKRLSPTDLAFLAAVEDPTTDPDTLEALALAVAQAHPDHFARAAALAQSIDAEAAPTFSPSAFSAPSAFSPSPPITAHHSQITSPLSPITSSFLSPLTSPPAHLPTSPSRPSRLTAAAGAPRPP